MSPFRVFAASPLLRVISHPFRGPLWTKGNARREGYLCRWLSATEYRRCTSLPGCIRLRNDLCCAG